MQSQYITTAPPVYDVHGDSHVPLDHDVHGNAGHADNAYHPNTEGKFDQVCCETGTLSCIHAHLLKRKVTNIFPQAPNGWRDLVFAILFFAHLIGFGAFTPAMLGHGLLVLG